MTRATASPRARRAWRALIVAGLVALAAGPAMAQQQGPASQQQMRPGDPQRRQALERRVREEIGSVVRERLELSDDQFRKLMASNRRFDERRRMFVQQERDIRIGLREEILAGDRANQPRVGELLGRLQTLQQQRLDLVAEEQRELSGFLTPVQRAKYMVLQDQIRRRVEDMRQRALDGGAGAQGVPPRGQPGRRPLPRR